MATGGRQPAMPAALSMAQLLSGAVAACDCSGPMKGCCEPFQTLHARPMSLHQHSFLLSASAGQPPPTSIVLLFVVELLVHVRLHSLTQARSCAVAETCTMAVGSEMYKACIQRPRSAQAQAALAVLHHSLPPPVFLKLHSTAGVEGWCSLNASKKQAGMNVRPATPFAAAAHGTANFAAHTFSIATRTSHPACKM